MDTMIALPWALRMLPESWGIGAYGVHACSLDQGLYHADVQILHVVPARFWLDLVCEVGSDIHKGSLKPTAAAG
jgi:hypothetical protein